MPTEANHGSEELGRYLVHPRSDLLDDRTRVLKYGDTFAVFDRRGDAVPYRTSSHGLYYRGTRFLSRFELRLSGSRPLLLGSTVRDDNALLTVDMANPDLQTEDETLIQSDTVHIFRARFVCENRCFERIRFTNFGSVPVKTQLSLHVEADFADIFEVRGATRQVRGQSLPFRIDKGSLSLGYQGLDGTVRVVTLRCEPAPDEIMSSKIVYHLQLEPKHDLELHVVVTCDIGEVSPAYTQVSHARAYAHACEQMESSRAKGCQITTSNELCNDWIDRSVSDLLMMTTKTAYGPYPYAGVPWYNTIFGRDGLITAREALWVNPSIAQGVLRCLAATQATAVNPREESEPGKIVHEMRDGEMAALGEVPFGRYYGTVDATPLFVMLAGDYFERTGDQTTIEELWPAISLALQWIDTYGDNDGDGFVEYARKTPNGLEQQGWKDSNDSVFHRDGALARGPIALCEVQGYVYAARLAAAKLAQRLGHLDAATRLTKEANVLKKRFASDFWCEASGFLALALDGDKKPCDVRTSNAGHCLFAGIVSKEHADAVMRGLLDDGMFSGWGVRTLSATERRYNPMSYHNGSVWPHDNALLAAGLARYGRRTEVLRIFEALFQASLFMDMHRMPELFCGFPRRQGQGPTLYPVACAPQAWAASSVFLLLEACLGIAIDSVSDGLRFERPSLPEMIDWIEIKTSPWARARLTCCCGVPAQTWRLRSWTNAVKRPSRSQKPFERGESSFFSGAGGWLLFDAFSHDCGTLLG